MKPTRPKPLPKKTPSKQKEIAKDPVKVYCRLRPVQSETDVACMTVISSTSVQITPPNTAVNFRAGNAKEVIYTFDRVFDDNVSQKEVFDTVALPLVEALVHGRNGLLFAYGVTGSGKTYTMNGEPHDGGIMPRTLDVLFNSIASFQAKKFIFKPDKMNGFDIQSEIDAMQERQHELMRNLDSRPPPKTPRKNSDPQLYVRQPDTTHVEVLDQDNAFAVFVTYVEIYNNSVYDLLDEVSEDMLRNRQVQVRILREDAMKNMYVHGVTEVEVKSPEEAFEAFYKGQRRKKVANTLLNSESSRSHSIFTIRLVQAPLDNDGECVSQSKQDTCVSQLSLVDLAGCERTNRTKNSGQRLREAGNINNSLMTLRSCLEALRENQLHGTNKVVPYRDSRLTHLFKNYLDGEGKVRMIVCVSPRAEDYDENVQVMKFAEMSQEVLVTRPNPIPLSSGFVPGRRRANQIYRTAVQQLEEHGFAASRIPIDVDVVFSIASDFPSLDICGPEGAKVLAELKAFLQDRIERREALQRDLNKKQERFRAMLVDVEKENIFSKQEMSSLNAQLEHERNKVASLQTKLVSAEKNKNIIERQNGEYKRELSSLRNEVANLELRLGQQVLDKRKSKVVYNGKMAAEIEKATLNAQRKHHKDLQTLNSQVHAKERTLRKVRQILNDRDTPSSHESSDSDKLPIATPSLPPVMQRAPECTRRMGMAIRNPRHRRSKSADGAGKWLDHCPATPVALNTVFQPIMKKRKSVTKLTDVKDITKGTERYCLTTQEQDTDGELETRLYKADVLPTCSGGAQVVFNDVELLKQTSPTGNNFDGPVTRKRSAVMSGVDVGLRCSTAVEGHGKRPHISS